MEQGFFLRARRILEQREAARLDHGLLVATITVQQASTPTAAAQARCGDNGTPVDAGAALAALLLSETDWSQAAEAQGYCFNRTTAAQDGNAL